MAGEQLYYIWSFEHDAWKAPDHNGFVSDFHVAGKYPYSEALDIVSTKNTAFNNGYDELPTEAMVPVIDSNQ